MARIADGPQQDRPGFGARGPRLVGETRPGAVPGRPRKVVPLHEQAMAEALGHPLQHALGLGHHVGADAVAGKTDDGQIHIGQGW